MFKHSILLIYRSFVGAKSSFFINLIGLSTGLACALLIYLWVNDELNFDKLHENDSRLYQVLERWQYADDVVVEDGTAGLLGEALVAEMPEIEYATTVIASSDNPNMVLTVAGEDIRGAGQYASKDYFNIFSFAILQGDQDQVLADKHSIVLSESLALKLFGTTQDILGSAVEIQHKTKFFVSGIFRDIPPNSSQQFDFVLPFEKFKEDEPWVADWENSHPQTYLLLKKKVDAAQLNNKIKDFLSTKGEGLHRTLFIRPFSDGYLYGNYENGQQAGGRIEYVRLFSVVAVFIMLIACINFMNLSTAKASRRLKEIGIKKTIGASRKVLIFQYLGESQLMAFLSLMVAIVLVLLLLPHFNDITGKQLILDIDAGLLIAMVSITLLTGLISGSYPAFYLSGFNPVAVLKGGASGGKLSASGSGLWARKGLVVFQFTLSIILIAAVLVVYKQVSYVQAKNIGYNKDNIIYFEEEGRAAEKLEAFLSEVKNIPGIVDASSASHHLIGSHNTTEGLEWEGKDPDDLIEVEVINVNWGMLEMLDINIAAGRGFSKDHGAEYSNVIVNESAIKAMGLTDPIGKSIKLWGEERQIIGITENFNFQSLHEKVKPLLFSLRPKHTSYIMARIRAGKEEEAIADLQQLYNEFNPGFPFNFRFLDEDYQAQYVSEQRVSILSRYFAGIAILISCLGLYGLVAFAAEQRRKEIGIRKVLGASVANIMALLSMDFIKLVSISIVIGSLLSWIAMRKWLEGFAYRIELGWWVFGVAGATALLIALVTVSVQAVKAARANPVKNLRTE